MSPDAKPLGSVPEYFRPRILPGAVYAFAVRPRGEGTATSASVQTRLAGVGRDPAPGALDYEIVDRAFTAGDADWQVATQSYNEEKTVGTTAVLGAFDGTLAYTPEFVPTAESRFTYELISTTDLARYTVLGVTNLNERTWTETNAANRAGMRFFRVHATPRD